MITTGVFWTYSDILLKDYIAIGATGDYSKVVKSGTFTPDECYEQWERVVKESNKAIGNYEFIAYIDNLTAYNALLRDYNTIKASLLRLLMEIDDETISYLASKGYKIVTTGEIACMESILAAMSKSNNLSTKIQMKHKQLAAISNRVGQSQSASGFEEIMAHLATNLGFQPSDDITLARYNEYRKIIKRQNAARSTRHSNGQRLSGGGNAY